MALTTNNSPQETNVTNLPIALTDNFTGIRNKEPNIMLHWLFTFKNNLEVKHSLIR